MADCKLFAGNPRGKKCGLCGESLYIGDIIYEWGELLVEIGCFVRYAAEHLSPPMTYLIPGADWNAP